MKILQLLQVINNEPSDSVHSGKDPPGGYPCRWFFEDTSGLQFSKDRLHRVLHKMTGTKLEHWPLLEAKVTVYLLKSINSLFF